MSGEGLPVGRIFGISIRVHISWFVIFGMMTWALMTNFPVSWGLASRIAAALITSLLFFASVVLHELMHSVVALRNKMPVGAVTLFVFGGLAQITEEPREPGMEFRVAIAGPLASIVLGLGLLSLCFLLMPWGSEMVVAIINWLGWINLVLGVFNLIPAFPMDGGRVLRALIWWRTRHLRRSTKIASTVGKVIAALFILGGLYLSLFTSYGFNGLWFAFIGWFLYGAASNSYQQLVLQQALQGHVAREIMDSGYAPARFGTRVAELCGAARPDDNHCFIVFDEFRLRGMITKKELKGVSGPKRAVRTVEQIMKPAEQLKTVGPGDDLTMVMHLLVEQDLSHLPVMENGQLLGMICRDNLLHFINRKEDSSS